MQLKAIKCKLVFKKQISCFLFHRGPVFRLTKVFPDEENQTMKWLSAHGYQPKKPYKRIAKCQVENCDIEDCKNEEIDAEETSEN